MFEVEIEDLGSLWNIHQKNARVTKNHCKDKSGSLKEIKSYRNEKLFKAVENRKRCNVKGNWDSSSEEEYSDSIVLMTNRLKDNRRIGENSKKPRRTDNKITNYFKDVKFASSFKNENKEIISKVSDFNSCKTERAENVIGSQKLKVTPVNYSLDQRKSALGKTHFSDEQRGIICAKQHSKDNSNSVPSTMKGKEYIKQTTESPKSPMDKFLEKVLEKIRNKSSIIEPVKDTYKNNSDNSMLNDNHRQKTVSDVMKEIKFNSDITKGESIEIIEVQSPKFQNPITKFIESLGLQKRDIVDSSNSSRTSLSDYCRLTIPNYGQMDTKSCEDGEIDDFISKNKSTNSDNEEESTDFADYLPKTEETVNTNSSNKSSAENFSQKSHDMHIFVEKPSINSQKNYEILQRPVKDCLPIINTNNMEDVKHSSPSIDEHNLINNSLLNQVLSEAKLSIDIVEGEIIQTSIGTPDITVPYTTQESSGKILSQSITAMCESDGKDFSIPKKPSLLEDVEIKNILIENYEKFQRLDYRLEARCNSQIDDLCKKLNNSSRRERKDSGNCSFKRFRKGKVKIYRIAKLKKSVPHTEESENLNIDELLIKMSQGFVKPNSNLTSSKSISSVSTSSSYISDETLSGTLSTGSKELSSPQQKLRKGLNEICKDKSLICDKQEQSFIKIDANEIKMKIQNIFLQVFDDLTMGRRSFLKYRRQSFENCTLKDGRLQLKSDDASMSVIDSGIQRSHTRFKLILYILKKIQTLLETNTKLTKRELFYQLKHLIGNQSITDKAINSISCLLDVGMWALNIVAQKGLVFGNLKILLASGETINCNVPGTLIPQDIGDIIELQSACFFILVVEKESIFHKLIEEDLPNRLTRPFVLITGKGFPDLNTQLFLKLLRTAMAVPVFLLVDADPHGINIMLNYRFGSVSNAHVSHHLAVPNAKWLGVFPSEIENVNVKRQPMSAGEAKLARQLLHTPYMSGNPKIADELRVLIEKNYKAGIEGLIKSDVYLSQVYLPTKFFTRDFI